MADEKPENAVMKVAPDVLQKIKILAAFDNKNVFEFNDSDLRHWIERKYAVRMERESQRHREADPPIDLTPELGVSQMG